MKLLVGYSVWNKVDMISWLLEGVADNFGRILGLDDVEVVFHFDACTDGSIDAFDSLVPYWLLKYGCFKPEHVHKIVSETEVREVGGHNKIIKLAMERGADVVVVAQDDQHFNAPLTGLHTLLKTYPDNLGVVTGRDAYTANYGNFTGSKWSESPVATRVEFGEFRALPFLNSGPIMYNRKLIQEVGFLDELYRAHYVWDDYGARAHKAGFVNGVLGMDVTHAKFGRMTATTWTDASADLARLRALHGPII